MINNRELNMEQIDNVTYKICMLKTYLKNNGCRITSQRMRLCRYLLTLKGHLTILEIYEKIKKYDLTASISTIYRTTALLCKAQILRQVQFGDGIIRYEQALLQNHYHLICEKCGKVLEIEEKNILSPQVLSSCCPGCKINYKQVNLFGICPNCLTTTKP